MKKIEEIKARFSCVDLVRANGTTLKRGSRDALIGICPFHNETSPSFNVFFDHYHCYGCGAHGDVIDLVVKFKGLSPSQALNYLDSGNEFNQESDYKKPEKILPSPEPIFQLLPPPKDAPPAPLNTDTYWTYKNLDGSIFNYICRGQKEGKKTFWAVSWGVLGDGPEKWHMRQAPAPRPLYGLDRLSDRPETPVLVCEGEKACDAATGLYPDFVCVSWSGGSNAVDKTDWSPLQNRDVTLWPDADAPGLKAAEDIKNKIAVSGMVNTDGLDEGFDAADLITDDPHYWLHSRIVSCANGSETDQTNDLDPGIFDDFEFGFNDPLNYVEGPPDIPPEAEPLNSFKRSENVIPVGYDKSDFYYYSHAKQMVVALSASEHTRANLTSMASAGSYWEPNFPEFSGKNGFAWAPLADYLMQSCRNAGLYDPSRIRGRGAWFERDEVYFHSGSSLFKNQERVPLWRAESDFIYEANVDLIKFMPAPLTTPEAHWLAKICAMLRWQIPAHGTLLAGWIVCAPICGALKWRPSIWLTAASGGGKSWVMDNIVNRCLSQVALYAAFNTTEAGLRQALNCDARPIIFDEAERDSAAAGARLDEILGYQRVASSESAVQIMKGDQSGRAKLYKPRSCFLFQSINTGITKKSDESRVTVLSLRDTSNETDIPFEDIQASAYDHLPDGFSEKLLSRSLSLLPVIRYNAEIFASAAGDHFKSRRYGDQLGALLAGAFSLNSTRQVTDEEALEIIQREEWISQSNDEDDRDEYKLLRVILSAKIRSGSADMPISRIIESALYPSNATIMLEQSVAERLLLETGLRLGKYSDPETNEEKNGIYFSTNHPQLKTILHNTEWGASWGRALSRVDGAISSKNINIRFGFGHRGRAVFIPLEAIDRR